jgi:integrase
VCTHVIGDPNRQRRRGPTVRSGGPRRRGRLAISPLDYPEPVDPTAFDKNVLRPALVAVGLPASRPATTLQDATAVPAVEGVRLHDLRQTFATMRLSAGVHFMQVSKWLGHSTFTLTLDVYGDCPRDRWRRSQQLAEPIVPAKSAEQASNVVNLFGRQSG